ncbi:MAG: hypothetical protein KF824_00135 [Fimbriimonadaceae bacterium]|nr:MAG: hypothetical protein KF824_00135 [Fimbriimonadaceae bacterium]
MITSSLILAALLRQTTPPKEPLNAKLDSLAFMAGTWEGTRGATWIEEVWTAPRDGVMHGSFRLHENGKLVRSESERLVQEGDNVFLHVRHFDAEFKPFPGESGSATFVLVSVGENSASFYQKDDRGGFWLSYERNGDSSQAWLHRDGKKPREELIFKFKRKG